jgi:neutral ceramidase
MTTLRAGAASTDITPPPGGMMDGYGNRLTPSQGVHDPLFARALVLDYGDDQSTAHPEALEGRAEPQLNAPRATSTVIIGCDLLGVHPWLTAKLRRRVRDSLGIAEDAVLLAATHNHAGPVGLRSGMFSRLDETLAEATVGKIVRAVERAWAARRPVTLKTGAAEVDTIGMNRRDPAGPADAVLRAVLFDGEDGPVASLLNFACHATVLSGENMLLSGEFPGVACRIVEAAAGAPAIYLNGACGDVNPMWMRQDFASVERAGQAVGGAAVRLLADLRAAGDGLRAHNIRWDEFLQRAGPGRLVEPRLRVIRRQIDIPLREFQSDEQYVSQIEAAKSDADRYPPPTPGPSENVTPLARPPQAERGAGGEGLRREAMAQLSRVSAERWAAAWSRRTGESGIYHTELQAISLGDGVALLGLPGEFFAETGALIRRNAGIEQLLIACYANDYAGYIVPEHAYDEGGYESGVTFFTGEAEAIIRKSSLELLREVCRDGD